MTFIILSIFFINLILFILTIFFAGIETALISINKIRIKFLADAGLKNAQKLLSLLQTPEHLLGTVLCGYNITIVLLTTLTTYLFSLVIRSGNIAAFISTIVLTPMILIIGEIVPKTYFRVHANRLVMKYVYILNFFTKLLAPVQIILTFIANVFIKPFTGSARNDDKSLLSSKKDLKALLEVSEAEGIIDEDAKNMIDSIIKFSDKTVKEIMIPRVKLEMVEQNASREEVNEVFIRSGYSRLPVYKEKVDDVVGICYAQDMVNDYNDIEKACDFMKDPFFIPETKPIDELFIIFKKQRLHFALVVDEYGGLAGIISMEDILEEIFGEIEDEFDNSESNVFLHKNNIMIVSSDIEIEVFSELTGFDFEKVLENIDEEVETLGGLLIYHFEDIPSKNDKIVIDNFIFEILESDPTRIIKVKVTGLNVNASNEDIEGDKS
ncbi:HlyC/CorC family transporter [bacterium]|nr:HlyC/CorC family transporter [bacterium]